MGVSASSFLSPLPSSLSLTDPRPSVCSNFVIDAVFSESYMRDPAELLHRIKMCVFLLSFPLV